MSNSYELTTVQRESSCKPPTKQAQIVNQKAISNGHGPVKANGYAVAVPNGGRKRPSDDDRDTATATNIFNRYNFKYIDDLDSTIGDEGVAHEIGDGQEDVVDASMSLLHKMPTAKQQKNINNNDVKPLLANANVVQSNCDGGKGHERQAAANNAGPQQNGDDAINSMLERRAISGTPVDCHNGNFVLFIHKHIPIALSKQHST